MSCIHVEKCQGCKSPTCETCLADCTDCGEAFCDSCLTDGACLDCDDHLSDPCDESCCDDHYEDDLDSEDD